MKRLLILAALWLFSVSLCAQKSVDNLPEDVRNAVHDAIQDHSDAINDSLENYFQSPEYKFGKWHQVYDQKLHIEGNGTYELTLFTRYDSLELTVIPRPAAEVDSATGSTAD